MNPLKKFGEWYERRHPIAKGILIVVPIIPFLVSCGLVVLASYFLGFEFFVLGIVPFTITGFVVLFIVVSVRKKLSKNVRKPLEVLLALPLFCWGCMVFFFIAAVIYAYWQISLLLLTSVGVTFIVWKLKRGRKHITGVKYNATIDGKEAHRRALDEVYFPAPTAQSKELKEQLARGVITQEDYEELSFALSNLSTGVITQEEYEQKKKLLKKRIKSVNE